MLVREISKTCVLPHPNFPSEGVWFREFLALDCICTSDEVVTALGFPCTIADSIAIDFVTWEGVDMTWSYGRYVDVPPPRVALANREGFARGTQLVL